MSTPTTANKSALVAAKHSLNTAAAALADAQRNHLRALRSENRARPVWISPDSDAAGDALRRAFDAYMWRAVELDRLGAAIRRA
jgi:5S rRNA maturation endonuclease (ribonuclease M5)